MSFSGIVRDARKYLINFSDSFFKEAPSSPFGLAGAISPLSNMNSSLKGESIWTLMPLRTGGLKLGDRCTMVPGVGKINSCAPAKDGHRELIRKTTARMIVQGIFIDYRKYRLCGGQKQLTEAGNKTTYSMDLLKPKALLFALVALLPIGG